MWVGEQDDPSKGRYTIIDKASRKQIQNKNYCEPVRSLQHYCTCSDAEPREPQMECPDMELCIECEWYPASASEGDALDPNCAGAGAGEAEAEAASRYVQSSPVDPEPERKDVLLRLQL